MTDRQGKREKKGYIGKNLPSPVTSPLKPLILQGKTYDGTVLTRRHPPSLAVTRRLLMMLLYEYHTSKSRRRQCVKVVIT